jgi:ABC-type transporter Mla subunit MlaD
MQLEEPTMNEQRMRFWVGIFAVVSLILLAGLIVRFGRLPTSLKGHDPYYIVFDYAPGVAPGTPVRRSGVRIGEVQTVVLDDQTGKVRVTILIDRPHRLYEGDQPILVHGLLGGDTSIDLVPPPPAETPPAEVLPPPSDRQSSGLLPAAWLVAQAPAQPAGGQPAGRKPVEPGSELIGKTQTDMSAVLKELSKMTPPVQDAFAEMNKTMQRYNRLATQIEESLREYRELGKAANAAFPDLKRTNDEVQNTARNWGKVAERVDLFIQTNQDKAVKTLENLNDTIGRAGRLLNDQNLENVSNTLKNVNAGTKNLESIAKNTEELLKDSRQTVRRVNDSIAEADKILTNLQQATKPFAERSGSIMMNLDEGAAKFNKSMTDVQDLFRAVDQSDGTLRRFLSDPSLYNNLNNAVLRFNCLFPRLERILNDVEVFADKIARHPEALGVRGAISPNSGLKEAPSTSYHPRLPDH